MIPSTRAIRAKFHPAIFYFIGVLGAFAAVIVATPRAPVLQDYPTWVYEGVAVAHALQGHTDPQFSWKHFPVPNILSDLGLGLLCTVMSWQWAAKLWLCFYLVLSLFACQRFATSFASRSSNIYWMAPTIVVLNLCFWWGFINFQFSVVLMLLFCSVLFRANPSPAVIGSLLILVFISHAISFAVCGLILLIHAVAHRSYRLLTAILPSAFLVAWYAYGRFVAIGNPEGSILNDAPIPYLSKAFLLYKVNSYFKSLGYVNPKLGQTSVASALLGPHSMYALLVVAVAFGLALVYLLLDSARAAFKERAPERLLWIAVGFVLVAALCCPSRGLGISDPGSRFMVCALSLGVMLVRPRGGMFKVASGLSVVLGVAGVVLFATLSLTPWRIVPVAKLPATVTGFAHVEPDLRTYYYQALQERQMNKAVFGTSLLYNHSSSVASSGSAATTAAANPE